MCSFSILPRSDVVVHSISTLKEDEKREVGLLAMERSEERQSGHNAESLSCFPRQRLSTPLEIPPPSQGQPKVGRLSSRLIGRRQLGPNRGNQVVPIRSLVAVWCAEYPQHVFCVLICQCWPCLLVWR